MIIYVRANDFALTRAIEAFVAAQVVSRLDAAKDSIESVTARVGDVNSHRGGVDKVCSLVLKLKQGRPVVVKAMESDLYFAIQRAAKTLRRVALKVLKRPIRRERSDPQRPGAFGSDISLALS